MLSPERHHVPVLNGTFVKLPAPRAVLNGTMCTPERHDVPFVKNTHLTLIEHSHRKAFRFFSEMFATAKTSKETS